MKTLAFVLAALGLAAAVAAAPAPPRETILVDNAGGIYAIDASTGARTRIANGTDPAVSQDGAQVALARGETIHVLDAAKRTTRSMGAGTEPAWAPDGRLAYSLRGALYLKAGGATDTLLYDSPGEERSPAWTPDGSGIVFASNQHGTFDLFFIATGEGAAPLQLTSLPGDETEPVFSPDARRIAFIRDGRTLSIFESGAIRDLPVGPPVASPTWSPDGKRIAVAASGVAGWSIFVVDAETGAGGPLKGSVLGDMHPAWGRLLPATPQPKPAPKPDPNELRPDLDQRAPRDLTVAGGPGRWLLGFTSATDNVGRGPLWVRGSRASTALAMRATQLIRLKNGRVRAYPNAGIIRYTWSSSHSHWHLLRFQAYELRSASDFSLVVRDRKSGFCLADHYGLARHRVRGFRGPHFLGNCRSGRPDALSVEQGTSIGYTDRYPAHFHGQNVNITNVPAGRYVLVHRADPARRLHEVREDNNDASVLISLTWPDGRRSGPRVRVLRTCEASEACGRR